LQIISFKLRVNCHINVCFVSKENKFAQKKLYPVYLEEETIFTYEEAMLLYNRKIELNLKKLNKFSVKSIRHEDVALRGCHVTTTVTM
jgi:hypothetical protein